MTTVDPKLDAHVGPMRLFSPPWASFDWQAALLSLVSLVLVFRFKWHVIKVLAAAALGGLLFGLA